ncbi:MAG: MFS transporter [Chloroflexi bacterium]|nr:MFS transporter [Chloroflexota bacterium]
MSLWLRDRLFYGWVMVAALFLCGAAFWGMRFSFGVFFKSIESEFTLSRTVTSAVFSLYGMLGSVFAGFGGWALDRYGPRLVILMMGLFTGLGLVLTSQTNSAWQLFVTYSLLLAMGTGAAYVVEMSTILRWFEKKRGLALGITGSGGGAGTIAIAPLATYLITSFNWRTAFIVLGLAVWLLVIPLSRLLKRDPQEIGALPDGVRLGSVKSTAAGLTIGNNIIQRGSLSLAQAFRTRSFWLVFLIWLFFGITVFMILAHIVPHVTDIGFSPGQAASVLSLISGTSVAGRVLMGFVSDRISRKMAVIICSVLQGGAMVWLIWSRELWMLYLFAVAYGFAYGGVGPVVAALLGDTFGLGKIGAILGVLELGYGVGAFLGPVIGGFIFDTTSSYSIAFLIGALAMLIMLVLVTFIRQEKR